MRAPGSATDAALASQVWGLLLQVLIGNNRQRYQQVAARTGLSMPQSHALMELNPDGRPASMRALAACLHSDPSNITGLVDRLEAKGMVERRADPSDRRVKALVLTDAGRRARAQLRRIMEEPPAALARLDPQQLRVMHQALSELARAE